MAKKKTATRFWFVHVALNVLALSYPVVLFRRATAEALLLTDPVGLSEVAHA